jgi:hypothetical protein
MNRYKPIQHRMAFAMTALAITALTFGLSVVVPTRFDHWNQDINAVHAASHSVPPPVVAQAAPAPVERQIITAQSRSPQAKHKARG